MGCCGNITDKLRAAGTIASGVVRKTLHDLFWVTGPRSDKADARMEICKACVLQTWMTKADYLKWLAAHGIEVLAHLDRLDTLPLLEKNDYQQGRSMFCRVCKCWLPAKTCAPDADCPKGKWKHI